MNLVEHHVVVVPAGIGHNGCLLGRVKDGHASLGQRLKLKRRHIGRSLTCVLVLWTHRIVLLRYLCLGAGQLVCVCMCVCVWVCVCVCRYVME